MKKIKSFFVLSLILFLLVNMSAQSACDTTSYELDTNGDGIVDATSFSVSTYNDEGQRIMYYQETDDGMDCSVDSKSKSEYDYDEDGNRILYINYNDNDNDGNYDRISSTSYTFDASGNTLSLIRQIDYDGDGEIDYVQMTDYTYDPDGKLVLIKRTVDSDNDGTIDNSTSTSYTYEGETTVAITEYDDDNDMVIDRTERSTTIRTYNEEGNLLTYDQETIDENDGTLLDRDYQIWVYDSNGNLESINYGYDFNGDGVPEFVFMDYYYFDDNGDYLGYYYEAYYNFDGNDILYYSERSQNCAAIPPCILCAPPSNITAVVNIWNKVMVSWDPVETATTYRFRARYKGTKKWQETVLRFGSRATIGARAGSTVEFQVQTLCDDDEVSEWSEIMEAIIPANKNSAGQSIGSSFDDLTISEHPSIDAELFPNPVQSELFVNKQIEKSAQLKIFSVTGQLVYQTVLNDRETIHKLNVENLEPGIYNVSIESEGFEPSHRQIVKVRR